MDSYACVQVEGYSSMYTLLFVPKEGCQNGVKRRTDQEVIPK